MAPEPEPEPEPAAAERDPNAGRMVRVHICWYCFIGEHERCFYAGRDGDCFCARIKHPAEMGTSGRSSQLYDPSGNPVDLYTQGAPSKSSTHSSWD